MSLEKNSLTDDKTYCKSIAKSISEILRFSFDEEFRKSCFELFGACSTQETEKEIEKRLIYLVENENTNFREFQNLEVTSQNKKETDARVVEVSDKENLEKECADQKMETVPSLNKCSNENTVPQNIFKRNWLQVSSHQYKEIIKRKKLNFYSQPQFDHNYQNELEFFSHEDSQTVLSCPILSLEEKIALPESSGGTIDFCKNKFRDPFKDYAQKYFKKNLNGHRHI